MRLATTTLLAAWMVLFRPPVPPVLGGEPEKRAPVLAYTGDWLSTVRLAVQDGVRELMALQRSDGTWNHATTNNDHPMGTTALAVAALLHSGVPGSDPSITRGFAALARLPWDRCGSVAWYVLATLALHAPDLDAHLEDIGVARRDRHKPREVLMRLSKEEKARLGKALQHFQDHRRLGVWWYHKENSSSWDLINTHLVLLALRALVDCGWRVPDELWEAATAKVIKSQHVAPPDAQEAEVVRWVRVGDQRERHVTRARPQGNPYDDTGAANDGDWVPNLARTASGLSVLLHALEAAPGMRGAGRVPALAAAEAARAWIQQRLRFDGGPQEKEASFLYTLYCLDRIGMITGERWLGDHDLYEQSAKVVLREQEAPGVWRGYAENIEIALALLLLKRSRGPTTPGAGDVR